MVTIKQLDAADIGLNPMPRMTEEEFVNLAILRIRVLIFDGQHVLD